MPCSPPWIGGGDELLETRIVSQGIGHRIEPEQCRVSGPPTATGPSYGIEKFVGEFASRLVRDSPRISQSILHNLYRREI